MEHKPNCHLFYGPCDECRCNCPAQFGAPNSSEILTSSTSPESEKHYGSECTTDYCNLPHAVKSPESVGWAKCAWCFEMHLKADMDEIRNTVPGALHRATACMIHKLLTASRTAAFEAGRKAGIEEALDVAKDAKAVFFGGNDASKEIGDAVDEGCFEMKAAIVNAISTLLK